MQPEKPIQLDKQKIIELYREKVPAALYSFYSDFLPENLKDNQEEIDRYITTQSQNRFSAALMFICQTVFKNRKLLTVQAYKHSIPGLENSMTRVYDADIITALLDIYIYLCHKYDKDVSIYGFSLLTGIDLDTIYRWKSGYKNRPFNADSMENVSRKHYEVYKRLTDSRQESLTGMLLSGKRNPVGIIAALNHLYGWADPGRPEDQASPAALSAENLPRLDSLLSMQRPELPAADEQETL